jgi:hypothetical protein
MIQTIFGNKGPISLIPAVTSNFLQQTVQNAFDRKLFALYEDDLKNYLEFDWLHQI